MDVYVLFDEDMGECQVFLTLENAMTYFFDADTGGWNAADGDDSLWMSRKGYFYIFRREIVG